MSDSYYQINKEKIKNYYENNKKNILKKQKEYRQNNKLKLKQRDKIRNQERYQKNKKEIIKKTKQYYQNNKNIILKKQKEYREYNKETLKTKENLRKLEYYKKNLNYKIKKILRSRFLLALRELDKSNSIINLIGCSIEDLKKHIESQFKERMSWENHTMHGWHIDHIKPCASFDLTDPEQQKECFHYTNLRPLWAKENLSKGSNII